MTTYEFDVATSSPRRGFSAVERRLIHQFGSVIA